MISFVPDWCHFRYCSLTYNLLSGKNSLFGNGLYIIKKASYQEKKSQDLKSLLALLKQSVAVQFRLSIWMIWRSILTRCEQRNPWNKLKSILQYHLFIQFTCQIYFFIYEWTKLFNFHGRFEGRVWGRQSAHKMGVWLKVLERPMRNLQAHQRL